MAEGETSKKDIERAEVINLGLEASKFEETVVGNYLFKRAAKEAHDALMQFGDVDPNDTKLIIKLQAKYKRFNDFELWVTEAINEGNAEYEQYCKEQDMGES